MPFAHVSSTRTTFICERIHIDVDDIEFLDWRDSVYKYDRFIINILVKSTWKSYGRRSGNNG